MTDQDRTTWTRARAPGAEGYPPSTVVHWRVDAPAQNGDYIQLRDARRTDANHVEDSVCREQA